MFGINIVSKRTLQELRETMNYYKRSLEDVGWTNLTLDNSSQSALIKEGFKKMIARCKMYYYNNPLAKHWCHLTTAFVFGEGLSEPKAKDEKLQKEVVEPFWNDKDNQKAFTSFQAQQLNSNKLQYEGNLFFVLFTDDAGDVRVRVMNTKDIEDIITDAEDTMRPIYYKVRQYVRRYNFASDAYELQARNSYVYYPDIAYPRPEDDGMPPQKLKEGVAIFHVKINCDINDKFGVPEIYCALDWMKAHKDMAADMATLVKSLSTLAWKKKVKGSAAKVTALKTLFHAKTDLSNIAANAGSTQYENEGIDTQPIDTPQGGIKNAVDGLRQMQYMVCSASGIFYHYFGDPSTGNLATAKSMELPMVKKFTNRQKLWCDIFNDILQYQIEKKIEVGMLPGKPDYNEGTKRLNYETDYDRTIDIDFPPILESDIKALGEALDIAKRNDFLSSKQAATQFMLGMNINNIEQELEDIDKEVAARPKPPDPFADPRGQGQDPNQEDQEDSNDGKKKEKPVKESRIEAPKRSPALRFSRKNNFVMARMNGYAKSLAGHFRRFQDDVKDGMRSSGQPGQVVGNIMDLEESLNKLAKGMKQSARAYFPIAVDIGRKFLQAHLRESDVRESLFEAQGRERVLLEEKISWNSDYIDTSLIPSIRNKITEALRNAYEDDAAFRGAISKTTASFEGRIEQYAGAFWSVEEAAVKESGRGTGLMVNFAGADDDSTCQGCLDAMKGNPYPIDEAPEPGSHECNGRCRHALQVVEHKEF